MPDIRDADDARARVDSRLRAGERVVWTGSPDPDVNFSSGDIFLIPFSILWTGIGASFVFGAAPSEGGLLWPLGILPLFGLYLVFGRFFVKRWSKRRTIYAITTQRALLLVGSRRFDQVEAHGQQISTHLSHDRRHLSVVFGASAPTWFTNRTFAPNTGMDWWPGSSGWPLAFYDVSDVEGLENALAQSRIEPKQGARNGRD